ncbi:alpha/beta fold hydrolase [Novosphingobium panipatense]|jgi:pimeloyl-ACP methyl ester carboxylesterase|uniref:alpha/beta fold hydrolase n=1 Tax=Novosphingobium panipatense TaxID=428991 RepID=UPI0039A32AAB
MISTDLLLDVTPSLRLGEPANVAATLHCPAALPEGPVDLLFAVHGGGYRRSYWHPVFADETYSFARWFTDRGKAVLAIDMVGMGESSRPEPERRLSRAGIAAAHASALNQVIERLGRPVNVTGIGHSMGGMMLITQAAAHPAFDRIAVLGWANEPMVLGDSDAGVLHAGLPSSGYISTPREAMRALFYAPDVPLHIIEADEAQGSATPATLGRDALTPGIVHDAARIIEVPVLIVQSEVDTSPNPEREIPYFSSSPDVELQIVEQAGHCQNFAGSRVKHWEMLEEWMQRTRP